MSKEPLKIVGGVVEVPQKPGLGVEPDMEQILRANDRCKRVGSGARDGAMAMHYIVPGWKYNPKQPSLGR